MGVGLGMHLGTVPDLCCAEWGNICVSFVCVQIEALRIWRTCASYKCAVGVSLDDAYPALWVRLAVPDWDALSTPAESGSVAQSRLVHVLASAETLMVASEILLQAGYALSFPEVLLVLGALAHLYSVCFQELLRRSGSPVKCVLKTTLSGRCIQELGKMCLQKQPRTLQYFGLAAWCAQCMHVFAFPDKACFYASFVFL